MIPSENELAEEFGTTRLTIRSAMDELVKSGQIRRVQGKGAFVGHKWFDEHERKGGFRQSVLASGATPSVRILARSKRYAGPYYADLFGIAEDDLLYSVRRLNCIDGEPVSIEMTLIPCLLFPGIEDVDISVFSLFETYDMLGRKPDQSVEKLDIEALGARDASLLNLEPGDLALVLEGLTYDSSGQAIEHAKSFYPRRRRRIYLQLLASRASLRMAGALVFTDICRLTDERQKLTVYREGRMKS